MGFRKTTLALLLVLTLVFVSFPQIEVAAQDHTIYIRADGTVEGTDKIRKDGNIFTLTDNIFNQSIMVEKFNIMIDGAGYTIEGTGVWRGLQIFNPYNVSIKTSYDVKVMNLNVRNFDVGILVFGYWGNIIDGMVITGNNLTDNNLAIRFSSYSSYTNNIITGNNITGNNIGISIQMGHIEHEDGNIIVGNNLANNHVGISFLWLGDYYGPRPNPFYMNNHIYNNNFMNNSFNAVNNKIYNDPDSANIWDNGISGNFWSNYNGTDNNGDGIGDTPYIIDENNQDNFPLMEPTIIPEFPSSTIVPLFLVASSLIFMILKNKLGKKE